MLQNSEVYLLFLKIVRLLPTGKLISPSPSSGWSPRTYNFVLTDIWPSGNDVTCRSIFSRSDVGDLTCKPQVFGTYFSVPSVQTGCGAVGGDTISFLHLNFKAKLSSP